MPEEIELLNKGANKFWSDLRGRASGQQPSLYDRNPYRIKAQGIRHKYDS